MVLCGKYGTHIEGSYMFSSYVSEQQRSLTVLHHARLRHLSNDIRTLLHDIMCVVRVFALNLKLIQ